MTEAAAAERRATRAPLGAPTRPGLLRRVLSAVRDGLYRPLAGDDDRVAYWLGHVRIGVIVSEVACWSVVGYVLLTGSPGRHSFAILAALALVIVACPCILLLPLSAMMRDSRGPTLFYVWSLAETAVVVLVTRLDGGSSSPLDALLFLALTYAAVAYSPYGVVAMGSVMTLSYLFVVELPGVTTAGLFFMVIMGSFTLICAMASANSWAIYDRQVLLIRTQETLASTDPLTGIPNRRAYMERVAAAVNAAAWGHQTVVCLVDLDGFKAVNDVGGHAAGDYMLKSVATALGGAVRETDTVARLGGDEFAVLADVSVTFSGEMLAERVRQAVAAVGAASGVTASVGVAEVQPGDDVEDLMHRADAAMYRSKSAGGNRVTALAC
ncbi:GGDEF domain-containing protein [Blastococcus sp. CT_GayMR20]|uniref:GGDEF domain-containing protein n=1 Tax=Blastococcus sp. CT_GayMR20 TaxID=2559609 RepID=UPI0010732328|nr:GGDEF domain-containing protein [Blastococcus sp. CT_GayMR20]TFV89363.1 GGDEF domain-containing protein [Blastococcus sp. CT_GayMR20]TFV89398.1 GGDEF domain-containing protein [Blastococcus sp. CT_GayMR20]